MPDPQEPFRRPTSAHTTPLRYPTLPPSSASVEEWLSRSRPTNMTSDQPTDYPIHSLSESWATLSVSDEHSEDGSRSGMTDTGSIIDQSSPDDVASLDEPYSTSDAGLMDEDDGQEDEGLDPTENSENFATLFTQASTAIEDSNLTARPYFRQPSESIEFIEPEQWPDRERVELKHTIRIIDHETTEYLKSRLQDNPNDSILMATVQQTMTKQGIALDKPFRVLYIGKPDFRNIILDKIGDVLVSGSSAGSQTSSTESSRYHVVPTSFGAGAVPNFAELLPIHVQLVVDECVEATTEAQLHKPITLNLAFKNRPSCSSWWDGAKYHVSSDTEWTLPDVAIFFISNHDDLEALRVRSLVQFFLERHRIPAMMISEDPLWKLLIANENIPVHPNSLHTCLESRNSQTGETKVLKRYPIDLKTFESITPGQLNRNLASIMGQYSKQAPNVTADAPKPMDRHAYVDLEKYPYNLIPPSYATKARELAPLLRLITLSLVSAIILSLGFSAVKALAVLLAQWVAGSSLSNALPTGTSVPTTTLDLDSIKQTAISTRQSGHLEVVPIHSSGWSSGEQAAWLSPSTPKSSPADALEIQVVGDCHVVIKPPHNLASSKKQPRFNVSVHRYDQALSHELSRLFDGVYTLRLEREDAYGPLNVTVTAKSKSPVNQTTTIDFGTPWLKIASWRRAARAISSQLSKDMQTAQTGLSEIYGRLTTDLQVVMGDVVKRSHCLRDNSARLHQDSFTTRQAILSRSKQISQVITRNAIQRFQSASSILRGHSEKINQKKKGIFSDAWNRIGETAAKVDICSMVDRARSAKSATLDRAQARVHQLMGHKDLR
ncbi:hypothetical protein N7492_010625 [Penicillium capsulatum]|uniref:Uncharacterized protein n=1 Tax=Penicillium capsulatum TaxID=69766 RepID=A0A9W9LFM1_9EURO|nr:hypothetical protein N7492_010625 [Penicillium capsulatum]KAJ6113124.1 hypothetical protein N7512_008448 [Penicillium capsulatum]